MRMASGYLMDSAGGESVLRSASVEEQVRAALRALLLTRRGERRSLPDLGSDLHRYVFRPLSQSVLAEMKAEVRQAIERGEERVRVVSVEILLNKDEPERIDLQVQFELKQSLKTGQVKVELYA